MNPSPRHLLPATPPLLNAAAVLFWGWQCDFIPYAVVMAFLLELPRFITGRIRLTNNEFNHVSDLSAVIFMAVVIYVFFTRSYHGIFLILSLLPFLLFLLVLAQLYSEQGYVRASALFISLRRYDNSENPEYNVAIDLSYPYFFITLLSASEGNKNELLFYTGLVIIIGWALWTLRPSRSSLWAWLLIVSLSIPAGYAVQNGLKQLQAVTESTVLAWIEKFMWRSRDPQRASTAIGTLGKLKLSDRIAVRVDSNIEIKPDKPLLLREASYLNYSHGIWTNYQNTMQQVDAEAGGSKWIINPDIAPTDTMSISFHLDDEAAIIPLPLGAHSISNVISTEILHSPYGATSLELNPGWIKYDVSYIPDMNPVSTPGPDELDIPDIYREELHSLAVELGLDALSPAEAITTTERFFLENFEYSLTRTERYPRGRYLTGFLFENRRGHCEFFATATALLLRAANVPTRYVVGYAIQEYSRLEGQYIGRASHAHSWVEAYINNEWLTVDTTPPVWVGIEDADNSLITLFVDFWSWLAYKLEIDDTGGEEDSKTPYLWLLLPVLLYYLWKIIFSDRNKHVIKSNVKRDTHAVQGKDSGFYRLCDELEKRHGTREHGQTIQQWLNALSGKINCAGIHDLLYLHYRYRFDPAGLDENEVKRMNNEVEKTIMLLREKHN